jgi:hypothetical protein
MEVNRVRAMVTAVMEGAAKAGADLKASSDAYKSYVEAAFPFASKARDETDKKMVEVMKKETAKGPILFKPQVVPTSQLVSTAKKMRLPDEFKKKLQDRVIQQRARQRK